MPDRFPGKVVPPENWHITLRFLGDVSAPDRDMILAYLDQHLLVDAFTARFGGLSAFPEPPRATVGFLEVEAPGLGALAAACDEAAESAGLPTEERPFHPHLTLSRIRPPVDMSQLIEAFPRFPRSMRIQAVTMFESTSQGDNRVTYREIERVDL